jgi:gas vesicle protein
MAQLVYEIVGNASGLANAVNQSIAKIQELQKAINGLNSGNQNTGLASAIANANSQALNLKRTIDDTNLSLKDKQGIAALDALGAKLNVIRGNAELFGTSIKNQQAELAAYQGTLDRLLKAGFEPMDGDVIKLKGDIDALTASIQANNAAAVRRPEISNSAAEVATFAASQGSSGGTVSSGSAALIAAFNKDLAEGKITAAQYNAEIATIAQNQARFAAQTKATIAPLAEEEGLLAGLNAELTALKAQRLQIVNTSDLARQNALIAETEAQVAALNNVGRPGFDSFGNSIKNATVATTGLGAGLRGAFGSLRQIAYILPGIGIAGLFNLAFVGISKATEALGLFNSQATYGQKLLANYNDVVKNASKQYGEQASSLKILYSATQDVTNSEKNRLLAAQELQKEFPSLFGNIKTETILNGDAADAYDRASASILENAKAKAAATKISELYGKQLESEFQVIKINNARQNELAKVPSLVVARATNNPNVDAVAVPRSVLISEANKDINTRNDILVKKEQQNQKEIKSQIDFFTQFAEGNNKIAAALSAGQKIKVPGAGIENTFEALKKQLDEIFAKSSHLADQSGLTGYALEVQKINDKYKDLNKSIDDVIRKGKTDLKAGKITSDQFGILQTTAGKDNGQLKLDQGKEISDATIAEAQRVSNEVQRINDEFGVKSEQSRSKELAQVEALYNKEINLAKGQAEIISAAQAGRLRAIQAINEKYLAIEADLWDRIGVINEQAQAELGDKASVETVRILKEWERRRDAANQYLNTLFQISNIKLGSQIAGFDIGGLIKGQVNTGITNAETADKNLANNRNTLSGLQNASSGFIQDFTQGLFNANQEIGADFESVFAGIAGNFAKTMQGVITQQIGRVLNNELEKAAKKNANLMSSSLQTAIGAAGLAGSAISGLSPKTSSVGQGLGGTLSGAAVGASIGGIFGTTGTYIGAGVGALVGLVAGLFGASKERKKLQQDQLEQAKEQTAALKASLAYTSSIVGRVTQAGLITGVDLNATGQLIAVVSGKQLQFVLDRK